MRTCKRKGMLLAMLLGIGVIQSTGSVLAEDKSTVNKDLTPVIERVQMLNNQEDLFNKAGSEFTGGTLRVKLNYDQDQTGIDIEKGDTLAVKLVPAENEKNFLTMDYQTSQFKLLEDNGVKLADLDLSGRAGILFTFAEISASFRAEINMPFEVNEASLTRYFEKNIDEDMVSFSYILQYDGKDTGKKLNFTLKKRDIQPAQKNFVKTSGVYIQDGELGEGNILYNIKMGTALRHSNEFIIYDTPDVNLGFDGNMKVAIPNNYGGVDNVVLSGTNYYAEPGSVGETERMEIFIYDIYYTTQDKGVSKPRQAEYEEKKIDLPRANVMTGEATLESMDSVTKPSHILVEKLSGEPLTEAEQQLIDENGGLYQTVGKGFKIRIKNFKGKEQRNGGYVTFIYRMAIKNNSPMTNADGFPIYLNSASYYGQEIPSCTPGDTTCTPITSEKVSLDQIKHTSAEVSPGSISGEVDAYSRVDFTKVELDKDDQPDMAHPLAGAVFTIYQVSDNGSKTIAINKDGISMENLITNPDGRLCLKGTNTVINLRLKRGNYIFEEVSAPEHYDIINKETRVVVGLLENKVVIANRHQIITQQYIIDTEAIHGTITDRMTHINSGEDRCIKYAPDEGYVFDYMEVDGKRVDSERFQNSYTFENIQDHHKIKVVYKKQSANVPDTKPDSDKPKPSDQVHTGDSTHKNTYLIGILLSGFSIAIALRKYKKQQNVHQQKNK